MDVGIWVMALVGVALWVGGKTLAALGAWRWLRETMDWLGLVTFVVGVVLAVQMHWGDEIAAVVVLVATPVVKVVGGVVLLVAVVGMLLTLAVSLFAIGDGRARDRGAIGYYFTREDGPPRWE